MITLYTSTTPNGRKISIALEELGLEYRVEWVNLQAEEQFRPEFLRDGVMANTALGRWWRLCLKNIAGFRHHQTDKGTFGGTWKVAMAENEAVLDLIGTSLSWNQTKPPCQY